MRNKATTAARKSFAGIGNLPMGEPIHVGSGVPHSGFPEGTRHASLPVSHRTIFLDVNGVRAARGISADKVNELVEVGKLLWVFNMGRMQSNKAIRNLRFWLPEVVNPSGATSFQLEEVISKILPVSRQTFSGGEICQWFLVSRPTVMRLSAECHGVKSKRVLSVARTSLASYLQRRWIGADGKAAPR
jgi:hypothetical protein